VPAAGRAQETANDQRSLGNRGIGEDRPNAAPDTTRSRLPGILLHASGSGSFWAGERRAHDPRRNACGEAPAEKSDLQITNRPTRHGQEIERGHECEEHETGDQAGARTQQCSRVPAGRNATSADAHASVDDPGDQSRHDAERVGQHQDASEAGRGGPRAISRLRRRRVPPRRRPRTSMRSPEDSSPRAGVPRPPPRTC
jgi:hypothetical protein